jgi:iron(III) transport system permease protein
MLNAAITPRKPPLFLAAAGIAVAIVISLPLTYLLLRAASVGGAGWLDLLARPRTWEVLCNSLGLALIVPCLSMAIAVPIAILTTRTDLPGRRAWLVAATLPLAIPDFVGTFALIAAFGPKGSLLQLLLAPLGVQELPELYGWPGTLLALTLLTYPYLLLTVQAGLQQIHPAGEDVARSLGYSAWAIIRRVLLPQLHPSIAAGSLIIAMYALQDFGATSLMQFDAFTSVIFLQYRYTFDRHRAAALALLLVGVVLLLLWVEHRLQTGRVFPSPSDPPTRSRRAYYNPSAGNHSKTLIRLGWWTFPALLLCGSVVGLSLVLPIGVTLFWLVRGFVVQGFSEIASPQRLLVLAWHSIWAAGLAAVVATLCALPIAILAVRFPSRLTSAIERCSYICFALPGILIALSLVFWGANYLPGLYQTLPMLVFAYLVMFLPQAVGTVRASLLQLHPQLEESARSLGRTPWQTLQAITLPLVRPGIISGAVLVFLTAIKELPATMLLAPIEFDTLAVHIWKATESISYADAAAGSLIMLFVSMGSTLLLLTQTRLNDLSSQLQILREVD